MPIVVLLLISLAAGSLIAWASLRYPTPAGKSPPDMAETTEQMVEQEMERHPWLLRLVRGRTGSRDGDRVWRSRSPSVSSSSAAS